jgi:hypothetical protein
MRYPLMSKHTDHAQAGQRDNNAGNVPPESTGKHGDGGSISAKELAFLAAILNPEECKTGAAESALRHALALFYESKEVLSDFNSAVAKDDLIAFSGDTPGGERLFELYSRQTEEKFFDSLRLDADESRESDEVRDFLSKNCNLEGKKRNKAWGKVRTVWENFEAMFVWVVNSRNERNRDCIIAAENRTAEISAANEGKGSLPPRFLYDEEVWQDWKIEFEKFKRGAAKYAPHVGGKPSKVSHYEIERADLWRLVKWKRWIKKHGGSRAVKPRTREEILGPLKKNNPKKKK